MRITTRVTSATLLFVPLTLFAQQVSPLKLVTPENLVQNATLFSDYMVGPTIEDLVATKKQFDAAHNTYIIPFHRKSEKRIGDGLQPSFIKDLQGESYNSDAVIIGTPTLRKSALTSSHQFIFSNYQFTIDTIVSDPQHLLIGLPSIVVTRPGGEIAVGEAKVRAIDVGFPLFRIGQQYLIFLHRPIAGSFSIRSHNAYLISNGLVHTASDAQITPEQPLSLKTVLGTVSNAVVMNAGRVK